MKVVSRFDRLYRDNFPFVWAAAHRCGSPHDAIDEVVQDVFVAAYRRLDELYWEISPRGWLYGVTRRIATRYRRSAAAATKRPHRHRQALDTMLTKLEDTQREAFVMTELLGMHGPEVAAELAIPIDVVHSRLQLATKRLVALAGSQSALRDEVAALRRAEVPTRTDLERTYAAIAPTLGSQWLSFRASAMATAKSVALPVAAGAIALTSYFVTQSINDGINKDEPTAAAPIRQRRRPAGPYVPAVPPRDPAAQVAPAAVAPAVNATASTPPALAAVPSVVLEPTLTAEVALIDRAQAALNRNEAAAALVALQEHADRFPQGHLSEARESTRVRALCKAGRNADAEAAAAAFHLAYPNSTVARQTPSRCATP